MLRRITHHILLIALGLLVATEATLAQQPVKFFRVGWLGSGTPTTSVNRASEDFQQGLRDIGYVEGGNLVIAYRYGNGDVNELARLAAELARKPVDVIVTADEPAALAAKRATRTIRIVATSSRGIRSRQHWSRVWDDRRQISQAWPRLATSSGRNGWRS